MTDCDHGSLAVLRRELGRDLLRVLTKSPRDAAAGAGPLRRASAFMTPGMLCILVHRVAHLLHARSWERAARLVAGVGALAFKAAIGPASCIGGGLFLPHPAGVTFHGRAGRGLTLYSMSVCAPDEAEGDAGRPPWLGDDVTLAVHATVLGPVSVGDRTRVAFRVALRADAPADSVVVAPSQRVAHEDEP